MTNCPWCGAKRKKSSWPVQWTCGSAVVIEGGEPEQVGTCKLHARIRELEAEAAGVARLLSACREFVSARDGYMSKTRQSNARPSEPSVNRLNVAEAALFEECDNYASELAEQEGESDAK